MFLEFDPEQEMIQDQAEEEKQAQIDLMSIEEYAQSLAEAQRAPSALPMPVQVTPEERAAHELTHHGKPAWCTNCVAGKDKEDAHFTVDEQSKAELIALGTQVCTILQYRTIVQTCCDRVLLTIAVT